MLSGHCTVRSGIYTLNLGRYFIHMLEQVINCTSFQSSVFLCVELFSQLLVLWQRANFDLLLSSRGSNSLIWLNIREKGATELDRPDTSIFQLSYTSHLMYAILMVNGTWDKVQYRSHLLPIRKAKIHLTHGLSTSQRQYEISRKLEVCRKDKYKLVSTVLPVGHVTIS